MPDEVQLIDFDFCHMPLVNCDGKNFRRNVFSLAMVIEDGIFFSIFVHFHRYIKK